VIRPLLGTEHRRSRRAVRVYRIRPSRNRVALSRRMLVGVSTSRVYPTCGDRRLHKSGIPDLEFLRWRKSDISNLR
jgi:hypothetical protein